jgi:hypothetical protein
MRTSGEIGTPYTWMGSHSRKSLVRRLARLADQCAAKEPREIHRLVVRAAAAEPTLAGATCARTLSRNGIFSEVIRLDRGGAGRKGVSEQELEKWIQGFPISYI